MRGIWNRYISDRMKTQYGVQLSDVAVDFVRRRARELGVSQGALIEFALRFVESKCPPDALQKWAASNRPVFGPKREQVDAGGRTVAAFIGRNERAFLEALARLSEQNGAWSARAFTLTEIADSAGLHVRDAWRAGGVLRARGRADFLGSPGLDRWGRPGVSIWWDTAKPPVFGMDVFDGLGPLRAWLESPGLNVYDRVNALRTIETEIGLSAQVRDLRSAGPLPDEPTPAQMAAPQGDWRREFRARFGAHFPIPETWTTKPQRVGGVWVRHDDPRLSQNQTSDSE